MSASKQFDAGALAHWCPTNPHPLSQLKTELVWEGKYDAFGNRRTVDAAGLNIPLQKIEQIDAPRDHAAALGELELDLFEKKSSRRNDFRNRLIWGDNKPAMCRLLEEFKGKVDLIYIDPPFDVGADFTMDVPIGDEKDTIAKEQSTIEAVAYRDMWGKGTDSYLHMMYERLSLMKELLSEKGSLYVHCDYRMSGMLRSVMTELFGVDLMMNEVIWGYKTGGIPEAYGFSKKHDTIFAFTKSAAPVFNDIVQKSYAPTLPEPHTASGSGLGVCRDNLCDLCGNGAPGQKYRWVRCRDVWDDVPSIFRNDVQGTGYATQKPEALLERIIKASTNEGDLVADFFCGSGTTGAVAEKLGRRWIMTDLGRYAIHTTRKRLIQLQAELHNAGKPYRAFDVYNLGRYERQWWQKERLRGADDEHGRVVLEFYKAAPLDRPTSPVLHGTKGTAICHVDGIDSVFTQTELRDVAKAARAAGVTELHCLAWEMEMNLRLVANALQAESGMRIRLVTIPREILEKNRTHVTFHDVASLSAEAVTKKSGKENFFDVKLTEFLPSLAEVPEKDLK